MSPNSERLAYKRFNVTIYFFSLDYNDHWAERTYSKYRLEQRKLETRRHCYWYYIIVVEGKGEEGYIQGRNIPLGGVI